MSENLIVSKKKYIILCSIFISLLIVLTEINIDGFYKNPISQIQTFFFYWGYLALPYFFSGLLFFGINKKFNKNALLLFIFFSFIIILISLFRWITNEWINWLFYWPSCIAATTLMALVTFFNGKNEK